MRQKSGPEKEPATQIVKNIRRATRRHFSAEDKIRIVLEGLRGEDSIAELCRREGIVQNLYYRWKITIAGMATATAEDKAALLKIVGRHFDGHTIANQSLDPVLLHLACRVGHGLVAGVELNAMRASGKISITRPSNWMSSSLDIFSSLRTASCNRRGQSSCYDPVASPAQSARSA